MGTNEKEVFNYNYSAKEQQEIKAIREKYSESQEIDKLTLLRRLDASVTQKAQTVSLILGIVGALILGCGMSLIMTDMREAINLSQNAALVIGIIVGVIGIALVCSAYPAYLRIVRKKKEEIAPEILRLTDELIK